MTLAKGPHRLSGVGELVGGDSVDDRVDTIRVPVVHGGDNVSGARQHVIDTESAEELLILGQPWGEDSGAGVLGELHDDTPDAAGGADDENRFTAAQFEGVHDLQGGDRRRSSALFDGDDDLSRARGLRSGTSIASGVSLSG